MKIRDRILEDPLIKNSIYLIISSFFSNILGFFFWIIAARYYTQNDIGITSAIFSSISLISMISSIGLPRALTFYLPRNKNTDKIINSCIAVGIISSMVFSLIYILGLKIWGSELIPTLNNLKNILIFIVATIAISISGLIGAAFTAGRRSSFQMAKEFVYHFIKILPLIFLVNFGAMGILISICIGLALSMIIGSILLCKMWKYIPRLTLDPIIKNMVAFSAGNYVAEILYNLPKLILPIMVLNILSSRSAGYFYIAMMMASLLYGISQSMSTSFLVESSDKDRFFDNVNKTIKFNIIILIPAILSFIILGKFVLNIFSPSYGENATTTMIILTVTSIPLSLVTIFNTVRTAQNRVLSMIKINLFVTVTTIILSILLIKMNIEGIAISYLIANTIGAMIVINRIKNPKEFTLKLLRDIKNDISYL